MSNRVKYFNAPSFFEEDWIARDPVLGKGEIAYTLHPTRLTPYKAKVGPGLWSELDYMEFSFWEDSTPVTNPIGDAVGNLEGKSDREIIDLMLNPYVAPAVSNVLNNATGNAASKSIFEVGQTWSSGALIQYSVSNQGNLDGAQPIVVNSNSGIFSNDGNSFPVGDILMNLAAPLTPATLTQYTITVYANHINGQAQATTQVVFYPKILWGSSQNPSILATEWLSLDSLGTQVTDDFTKDYSFASPGYHYLAIPSMLSPNNLTFTDVTDPNAPSPYGMEYIGQVTINNGVGSYSYHTYRSTYNIITNNSTLRVA